MKIRHALAPLAVLALAWATGSPSQGQSVPISEVSHIHGIGFDAVSPDGIFLATHNGLFKADQSGSAVLVSTDRSDYMGFTPDPARTGRLLASGHPEGGGSMGVIVSEDGGASWTQLSLGVGGPVDFHSMTISLADPQTVYGLFGDIQISRDGGATWTIAGQIPGQIIDIAASPSESDVVYAGLVEGLMLSTDAGKTWSLAGPSGLTTTMVEATSDGSVYAFFASVGLFKLSASTETWSELATDFGESYLLHLAADPADPRHLVAVTETSAVLESIDGGRSWEPFGP